MSDRQSDTGPPGEGAVAVEIRGADEILFSSRRHPLGSGLGRLQWTRTAWEIGSISAGVRAYVRTLGWRRAGRVDVLTAGRLRTLADGTLQWPELGWLLRKGELADVAEQVVVTGLDQCHMRILPSLIDPDTVPDGAPAPDGSCWAYIAEGSTVGTPFLVPWKGKPVPLPSIDYSSLLGGPKLVPLLLEELAAHELGRRWVTPPLTEIVHALSSVTGLAPFGVRTDTDVLERYLHPLTDDSLCRVAVMTQVRLLAHLGARIADEYPEVGGIAVGSRTPDLLRRAMVASGYRGRFEGESRHRRGMKLWINAGNVALLHALGPRP